jgi:hypothetical protein
MNCDTEPKDCTDPVAIDYVCKSCHKPGTAHYERSCPPFRLEIWRSMLACNRCADYQNAFRRLSESIWHTCYALATFRAGTRKIELLDQAAGVAREKLVDKTKAFSKAVCDFWRLPMDWEPEFVQVLLDKPKECFAVLTRYANAVRADASQLR